MKTLLLTMDLEEFVTPSEVGMQIDKSELFNISIEGLKNFLNITKNYPNLKITFFTTWEFAENAEKQIKEIIKSNKHEIALHGLTHNINYPKMQEELFIKELKEAKQKLENKFKIQIKGFRAPQMGKINTKALEKIGLKYDSSLHPTYLPGRYNNFSSPRKPYTENGIKELPTSVTPILRLPYSWVWLRNMCLLYTKICSRLTLLDSEYISIYLHPWEFIDINTSEFKTKIPKIILRNTGEKYSKKVNSLIIWYLKIGLKPKTISEYLKCQ